MVDHRVHGTDTPAKAIHAEYNQRDYQQQHRTGHDTPTTIDGLLLFADPALARLAGTVVLGGPAGWPIGPGAGSACRSRA